jgi:capsular polysaccharide transport system permease protein
MRIIVALILRDMRTRFGRSYLSYIIAIGWPLTHMTVIMGGYLLANRIAPMGDDPGIFISTGGAPYILCLYPARFTAFAIVQNKSLLQFSILSPISIIFARAVLEILSACVVFILFFGILSLADMATMPFDMYRAAGAIALTICLGVSFGTVGVILCAISPIVGILCVVFTMILLYLTSGVFLPLAFYSETVKAIMWYNPLFHVVGLLRSAYYSSYGLEEFSFAYVFFVSNILLCIGLLGERFLRGKILSA